MSSKSTDFQKRPYPFWKRYIAYKRNDFVLRAVNALLENRVTLGAIAQYLYFNLSEDHQEKGIVPFVTVYKYGKKG